MYAAAAARTHSIFLRVSPTARRGVAVGQSELGPASRPEAGLSRVVGWSGPGRPGWARGQAQTGRPPLRPAEAAAPGPRREQVRARVRY